ncbi:hypothetical protein TSOC_010223 [Tetrabaena socialis]|uniref:Uncharacterized protein n=1 Tax=Tetrabaena socialis TaxID=47790 RepID=A0A2J7ZTW5_9CHLO|nr:hypothetical protein TSOC_010223 [Tetrabaena socialis]|eukprot:PNH03702.1 hypothetical protein TSOC_010223 [Tetrabaena socialis]
MSPPEHQPLAAPEPAACLFAPVLNPQPQPSRGGPAHRLGPSSSIASSSASGSLHRCPTCISLATLGLLKSTTTRLPPYPVGAQLARPLVSMVLMRRDR